MKKTVRTLVLRTAGTNCDKETLFAFKLASSDVELVHINSLIKNKSKILQYDILAIPGGFSYGDDISAGKIFANELKYILADQLLKFSKERRPIIGICNGFQVLVKVGLLPKVDKKLLQTVTLSFNDSDKFEDRWVYLKKEKSNCIFTRNLPEVIYLPVAHGEGKFIPDSNSTLKEINANNQVVFKYVNKFGKESGYPDNPNGSVENIAAICNKEGNVLGMMPHPERHISFFQHPRWKRAKKIERAGDGLFIFRNAVEYAKKQG